MIKTGRLAVETGAAALRPMNPKQARFVAEYLIDLNGTQAAIRAGYSKRTANEQAARLLAKAIIQEAVQKGREEQSKRAQISADAVVAELAKIGFANMGDYMVAGPGGDPHLDFSKLTREQKAALAEVTVEDFLDGRGEDARAVRRVKFKLADKRAALVDLGRHLGIFKADPIELTAKVRIEDVRARITSRVARIAAARGSAEDPC